jgi:hypothetical protein
VCTNQHAVEFGLCDQHAVEWVGMMERQFRRTLGVVAGYRQKLKTMAEDRLDNPPCEAEFPDRALYANFPDRSTTGKCAHQKDSHPPASKRGLDFRPRRPVAIVAEYGNARAVLGIRDGEQMIAFA